ncbi:cyclophilin-like fold protein [uncultured Algoriphagus sp.]|uniref:cyclophilin-like fold protein n=1 Tax=uncultured Algoriphagus sp. TaxID=417365 RepID=UPI00338F0ABE
MFYKDFKTSYRYSRIGKFENPNGLLKALGKGKIQVELKKLNKRIDAPLCKAIAGSVLF